MDLLSIDEPRATPRSPPSSTRASAGSPTTASRGATTTALDGLTIVNAFFENSTRTLLSFEIAANRLGAQVVTMQVEHSSIKKGETLEDTARTLNAMRPDALVIRHGTKRRARRASRRSWTAR